MILNIKLKELEKNTWKTSYENGLIDIAIGLICIASAVCHIFDDIRYFLMPLYLIPILFLMLTKKYITIPRMGVVKFNKRRKKKSTIFIAVMTSVLIFLVILTIVLKTNYLPEGIASRIIISAVILLICFANAFFLNFNRLYIYGIVIAGAFNLNEYIRENHGFYSEGGYDYLLDAIVILITGCIYLVKFLKKYPLPIKRTYNG
jgi:uncharacterized membrane protein